MPSPRTEELAKQGALVTERIEMGPVVPAARREKYGIEPRAFFDISDSTRWPAHQDGPEWDPQSKTGGRRYPMEVAYRAMVAKLESLDTEAAAEQAGGSTEKGGILTFGFGPGSTEGHDVNSANFETVFARPDMQPGGGTHIADALRQANEEYDEEFGDKPVEEQPIKLDLVLTDGALDDLEIAEPFIRSANRKHVILALVFGYDEPAEGNRHHQTLLQWGKIAQDLKDKDEYNHQYLFVVPFDDTTNADDVSRDAQIAVS